MGANFDWLDYVRNAGGYASPLLFGALIWLDRERRRLLDELKTKDEKLGHLAERLLTVAAELKILFDRKGSGK